MMTAIRPTRTLGRRTRASVVIRVVTLAVAAAGWELAARTGLVTSTVLPPLSSVVASLVRQLGQQAYEYAAKSLS